MENNNLVVHPEHYNHEGRKECWDEMLDIFDADAVIAFDVLSAYKYLYRAGTKQDNPESQDLEKVDNYLKHACKLLCTTENNNSLSWCRRIIKNFYLEADKNGKIR